MQRQEKGRIDRPTALQAQAENKKTSMPPKSPPMNTSGMAISTVSNGLRVKADTSSMKALKRRKDANAAEPVY
jgi:hypothetical protein